MSRPLPPRNSISASRLERPVQLPRPGTLTAGQLHDLSHATGRAPLELLAAHILSGVPAEPLQHPLRRKRGDTIRELAKFVDDGLAAPTRDWFKLGNGYG